MKYIHLLMRQHSLRFIFFFLGSFILSAQIGGDNFALLNQPFDARSIANAGNTPITFSSTLGGALINPSLLNKKHSNKWSIDHISWNQEIRSDRIAFARQAKRLKAVQSFSFSYFSPGSMERTNTVGAAEGEFLPYTLVFSSGLGKQLNEAISIGVQAKVIYSAVDIFSSSGVYFDFAGTYTFKNKRNAMSVLVQNAGIRTQKFTSFSTPFSPLEISATYTIKPEFMPIRWSISMEHLQNPRLDYADPDLVENNTFEGTTSVAEVSTSSQILQHMSVGAELVLSEHAHFRLGYDYGRAYELGLQDLRRTTGFSWGFSLRFFQSLQVHYARSSYHLAGAVNAITLQISPDAFVSKIWSEKKNSED